MIHFPALHFLLFSMKFTLQFPRILFFISFSFVMKFTEVWTFYQHCTRLLVLLIGYSIIEQVVPPPGEQPLTWKSSQNLKLCAKNSSYFSRWLLNSVDETYDVDAGATSSVAVGNIKADAGLSAFESRHWRWGWIICNDSKEKGIWSLGGTQHHAENIWKRWNQGKMDGWKNKVDYNHYFTWSVRRIAEIQAAPSGSKSHHQAWYHVA